MQLTVKRLKEKLANLNDHTIVYIERIEDVYFNKHGWETKNIGVYPDNNTYFEASQCCVVEKDGIKEFIILGHY